MGQFELTTFIWSTTLKNITLDRDDNDDKYGRKRLHLLTDLIYLFPVPYTITCITAKIIQILPYNKAIMTDHNITVNLQA